MSFTGSLPSGVSFAGGKNGAATLSGTPAAGTEGTYIITVTAKNGTLPNGRQTFTLTVQDAVPISRAPAITSAATTTFTAGVEGTFTVRTTGLPTSTITLTGAQPDWLTLLITPTAPPHSLARLIEVALPATLSLSPRRMAFHRMQFRTLTLLVLSPSPAITSVDNATFITGIVNTFTVKTKATSPITTLSYSGSLPSEATFVAKTHGTRHFELPRPEFLAGPSTRHYRLQWHPSQCDAGLHLSCFFLENCSYSCSEFFICHVFSYGS